MSNGLPLLPTQSDIRAAPYAPAICKNRRVPTNRGKRTKTLPCSLPFLGWMGLTAVIASKSHHSVKQACDLLYTISIFSNIIKA